MPKKPNYSFEKRRKELERKAKKEARREERRTRGEQGAEPDEASPTDAVTPQVPSEESKPVK